MRCFLTTLLLCSSLHSADVSPRVLDAISVVETGQRDWVVGKNGERSRWQISQSTWRAYSRQPWPPSSRGAARAVAVAILSHRIHSFAARFGRLPNAEEIYCLWHRPAWVASYRTRPLIAKRCHRFAMLNGE